MEIQKPKISYIFKKTFLSIICDKCGRNGYKVFKKRRICQDIKSSWFN